MSRASTMILTSEMIDVLKKDGSYFYGDLEFGFDKDAGVLTIGFRNDGYDSVYEEVKIPISEVLKLNQRRTCWTVMMRDEEADYTVELFDSKEKAEKHILDHYSEPRYSGLMYVEERKIL